MREYKPLIDAAEPRGIRLKDFQRVNWGIFFQYMNGFRELDKRNDWLRGDPEGTSSEARMVRIRGGLLPIETVEINRLPMIREGFI